MVEKNSIPFKIEIKIYNSQGDVVYHFRPAKDNLTTGMRVTKRFVREELGATI